MEETLVIYTDGACRGNGRDNNIGGIGAVFIYNDCVINEYQAGYRNVTNNIMELKAVTEAFDNIKKLVEEGAIPNSNIKIKIYSDSGYLINAFNEKWMEKWKRNGWKTATGDQVKNINLWKQIDIFVSNNNVEFIKVKGHSTDRFNRRADELANQAMDAMCAAES
jgi:ribonuclease HI